jgi:hypothetical protein
LEDRQRKLPRLLHPIGTTGGKGKLRIARATPIIVLLLKRYQFNDCDNMPIIGIGRKSTLRIYWPVRAQGIGGARSQNRIAVLLLEFALCANSMLVSSVEFCLRQNSRSKSIMGPDSNSQSEFTFRLSKRIYDRNPPFHPKKPIDKPEFFAEQKMRPYKVLKKPSPSIDFL